MIKMIIDLDEGPLFSAASEAASNAGMTIEEWVSLAMRYMIISSATEFSAGGGRDVTCTVCGATLIKRPPEMDEFIARHQREWRWDDRDEKEPWQ